MIVRNAFDERNERNMTPGDAADGRSEEQA